MLAKSSTSAFRSCMEALFIFLAALPFEFQAHGSGFNHNRDQRDSDGFEWRGGRGSTRGTN